MDLIYIQNVIFRGKVGIRIRIRMGLFEEEGKSPVTVIGEGESDNHMTANYSSSPVLVIPCSSS
jgi:hypothetical protein